MVLIQLLLPLVHSSGSPEQHASFVQTRDELGARFTGLTAYVRSPAKGLWTSPGGGVEEDDVVMIEVVTETFERQWWREYAAVLRQRFEQEAIHVRALPIEVLDAAAS